MKLGVMKTPLKHNGDDEIVFAPTIKLWTAIIISIATILMGATAIGVKVHSVIKTSDRVPAIESRMDSMELMQIGIWCLQKDIVRKLYPNDGEQKIEQIETMLETLKMQQKSKRRDIRSEKRN